MQRLCPCSIVQGLPVPSLPGDAAVQAGALPGCSDHYTVCAIRVVTHSAANFRSVMHFGIVSFCRCHAHTPAHPCVTVCHLAWPLVSMPQRTKLTQYSSVGDPVGWLGMLAAVCCMLMCRHWAGPLPIIHLLAHSAYACTDPITCGTLPLLVGKGRAHLLVVYLWSTCLHQSCGSLCVACCSCICAQLGMI